MKKLENQKKNPVVQAKDVVVAVVVVAVVVVAVVVVAVVVVAVVE